MWKTASFLSLSPYTFSKALRAQKLCAWSACGCFIHGHPEWDQPDCPSSPPRYAHTDAYLRVGTQPDLEIALLGITGKGEENLNHQLEAKNGRYVLGLGYMNRVGLGTHVLSLKIYYDNNF
jgi:hypothetical protein